MLNTILFFTSELEERFESAKCNELYKKIDGHLSTHQAKSFFHLFKYDQPTGEQVLEKIAERPAYIQYCGHGGEEGAIQLIDANGAIYSLPIDSLEQGLKSNYNLECLFFGSCHSNKLVERLSQYAEYTIGFTESPKADFVIGFYDRFYARLAFHGSPYKAFLEAREKLHANRTKTAGSQVIFKSKNNKIMEMITLEGRLLSEKAQLAHSDTALAERINKMASLQEQAEAISEQLLFDHPFAIEVVEFHSYKKKLAHDIAAQVMVHKPKIEIEKFSGNFLLMLDLVQDVMVAYEERKSTKPSLLLFGKRLPTETTERAFESLMNSGIIQGMNPEFQKLLALSVKYCAQTIKRV